MSEEFFEKNNKNSIKNFGFYLTEERLLFGYLELENTFTTRSQSIINKIFNSNNPVMTQRAGKLNLKKQWKLFFNLKTKNNVIKMIDSCEKYVEIEKVANINITNEIIKVGEINKKHIEETELEYIISFWQTLDEFFAENLEKSQKEYILIDFSRKHQGLLPKIENYFNRINKLLIKNFIFLFLHFSPKVLHFKP